MPLRPATPARTPRRSAPPSRHEVQTGAVVRRDTDAMHKAPATRSGRRAAVASVCGPPPDSPATRQRSAPSASSIGGDVVHDIDHSPTRPARRLAVARPASRHQPQPALGAQRGAGDARRQLRPRRPVVEHERCALSGPGRGDVQRTTVRQSTITVDARACGARLPVVRPPETPAPATARCSAADRRRSRTGGRDRPRSVQRCRRCIR